MRSVKLIPAEGVTIVMETNSALTVITGSNVYAPEPLGAVDVVLGGTRILAVETGLAASLSSRMSDVQVIDANGQIVTPGLIDGHFHPLGGGDLAGPAQRQSEVSAIDLLRSGVTTGAGVLAADTASRTFAGMSLKSAALAKSGFSLYWYAGSVSDPLANLTGSVDSDVMHLSRCAGVKLAISESMCSTTPDELAYAAVAAIRSTRIAGKRGNVHLHVGAAASGLTPLFELIERTKLNAASFQPTHVNRSTGLIAQSEAFLKEGGTVDLTATLPLGGGNPVALDLQTSFKAVMNLGPHLDQITFSSDGNVTVPQYDDINCFTGWRQPGVIALLEAWRSVVHESDLPFEDTLKPVTSNPARVLGQEGRKGCIRVGADADLVIWDDALRPEMVFAAGRMVFQLPNSRYQSKIANAAG